MMFTLEDLGFTSFSNGKVSPMRMDMRTTYAILNTMKMLGMKP